MTNFDVFAVSAPVEDSYDEVTVDVALSLEAWTDETGSELFHRACKVLRTAGIRVKAGYAPALAPDPEAASALEGILWPGDLDG
jgi:hypothetical protein